MMDKEEEEILVRILILNDGKLVESYSLDCAEIVSVVDLITEGEIAPSAAAMICACHSLQSSQFQVKSLYFLWWALQSVQWKRPSFLWAISRVITQTIRALWQHVPVASHQFISLPLDTHTSIHHSQKGFHSLLLQPRWCSRWPDTWWHDSSESGLRRLFEGPK